MSDDDKPIEKRAEEPPVVARLVVEIRSDGTRTIARGALEDTATGQTVSIESHGTTPMALARSMLESLAKLPLLSSASAAKETVKNAVRALLPSRGRRG